MKMFFMGVGATYLSQDPLPATVPTGKEGLDGQLVFYIWASLEDEVRYLVEGKNSGLVAWKAVLTHFQKSNLGCCLKAHQDLYQVHHNPSKPIAVYLHTVDQAVQVLKDLSVIVSDTEVGDIILMNLHESFSTVCTTILTSKVEPDLKQIKDVLSGTSISTFSSISIMQEPDITPSAFTTHVSHCSNNPSTLPPSAVDSRGFHWCNPDNEGHCFCCG
jgi:hypothetical protein